MADFVVSTTYFDQPGQANTDRTLEIAKKRAEELGIKTILVASTQGTTGRCAFQDRPDGRLRRYGKTRSSETGGGNLRNHE